MTPEYFLPQGNRSHQKPKPASPISTAQIAKSWSGPIIGNDILINPSTGILYVLIMPGFAEKYRLNASA
jgi:hypothetical protein